MLSFAVLSGHDLELDLLLVLHASIGEISLSDTLVETLALLLFLVTDAALFISLESVDVHVLNWH